MPETYTCPVKGCTTEIPKTLAFCKPHWFSLPRMMRDKILLSFKAGPGSAQHLAALVEARQWIEARQTSAVSQAKEDLEAIKRRQRAMAKRED